MLQTRIRRRGVINDGEEKRKEERKEKVKQTEGC